MTFPSFTAGQSVYRNTPHCRLSSPAMRICGITVSQCVNAFLPNGSYQRSCVGCTCNDGDLSCCCYDLTRNGKRSKTGPIAVQVHLNDDGRIRDRAQLSRPPEASGNAQSGRVHAAGCSPARPLEERAAKEVCKNAIALD